MCHFPGITYQNDLVTKDVTPFLRIRLAHFTQLQDLQRRESCLTFRQVLGTRIQPWEIDVDVTELIQRCLEFVSHHKSVVLYPGFNVPVHGERLDGERPAIFVVGNVLVDTNPGEVIDNCAGG